MSVEAPEHPTPSPRGGSPGIRGRERPVGGFELWSWLIMHVIDEGVDRVNFGFVAARWQSPFWRTWDWALLVLALIHGINGLRIIVQDYVRWPAVRFAIDMAFFVIGFALFVLGTVVVFTFDPSQWPGTV